MGFFKRAKDTKAMAPDGPGPREQPAPLADDAEAQVRADEAGGGASDPGAPTDRA